MNRRRKLTLIISVVLLLACVFSTMSSALSGVTDGKLGDSPYITELGDKLKVDSSQFYDGTVIHRLPSTVKDTDVLSLIIEIDGDAILSAYDSADTTMSLAEFYNSEAAIAIRENTADEAARLCEKLSEKDIDYALGESYTTIFAGFEITVKASDFVDVCQTLGSGVEVIVGDVYETEETKLVENNVNAFETGIFDTTGFDYDGTGMVVAVLDTGTDYYHTAFSTGNFTAPEEKWGLTFAEVEALVGKTAASGFESNLTASDVYISGKLPYGYDYADKDSDVFPINSQHGTHVAGIIAGKDDKITGVAPNAQIVTMKIFSDVEQTSRTSWILAALEDCVVLGVDVINMSIGTGCGFSRESDKEKISGVYDKIRERGISMIVAASNSFNSTYSSEKNGNLGLTSNPDSATVGSPSTYDGAMSVASIEGAKTSYILFGKRIIYFEESTNRVSEEKHFVEELLGSENKELEIEYVVIPGSGIEADYTGINVKGKIALIRRGTTTFEEKANTAEKMGAAGAIIYNNVSGDIKMNVGETAIPVCSISQNDGEALAENPSGKIKVSYSQAAGPFMSDFSSWGPAPDLSLKPEITAHGGSILSAVPGQDYDRISGTSMATPNITGVTTLLRQYVMANFPESVTSDPVEVNSVINRLMMSTADIIYNKNGNPYSVRKQGAGLANLVNCASTTAYILTYDRAEGSVMDKSKIELGDDPSKTGVYTLVFTVDNFGTSSLSYDVSALVMTEGVSETKTNQGETTVTETAYMLGAATEIVSVIGGEQTGNKISVAAASKATVTLKITLDGESKKYLDESFENGMYVEGFVLLDAEGETVDLNVPYLAFYGDWTKAPMFDLDFYETNKDELDDSIDVLDKTLPDAYATRPIGGISDDYVSYLGSFYYEQKPGSNKISADRKYISLTNQANGVNNLRYVWAGLLRNADRVEITITEDSTGEVVFETVDKDIRKSYGDGGPIRPSNIDVGFSAIDENLKNNAKYTVNLKGYLDYGDGGGDTNSNNTFTFPITVDFEAPTLTDCEFYTEYDKSAKKNRLYAKMAIYDNHYSMALLPGYVGLDTSTGEFRLDNFERYLTPIYSEENSTSYVVYELTDYIDDIKEKSYHKNTFAISVYDYALNISTYEIALPYEYTDLYFEETDITLSPNQTYDLSPIVYPDTEWGELVTYTSTKESVARVVNNKLVATGSGTAVIYATAELKDGSTITRKLNVKVLSKGDAGYKKFDAPVVDSFTLSGYYVNKAFYFLSSDERDIGETGDTMIFSGNNYNLKMFPSESVSIFYDLDAYFPKLTKIVFESSNEAIAKVTEDGTITAVKEGYASITAKVLMDGKSTFYSQTIGIEVKEPYVTSGPALSNYFGNGGVVSIPSTLGITEIGQFAFSNFDYIPKDENDEISEESPEYTKIWYIGDDTIEEVIIPEGVEKIGAYAFANLTKLRKVYLPSTLTTIDYGAFYGCNMLTSVVGIGNVKFINQNAFANCALDGAMSFDSAVAIADYAFANNPLISSVELSASTQSVGAFAFANNTSLASLSIGSDSIKLGQYAFSGCSKLTSVSVNAPVIPAGAFNDCTSLRTVELGRDVAVIGEYAFRNAQLTSFTVKEGNETFFATTAPYLLSADGTEIMLVAPATTSLNVSDTKITSIAAGAFSGNSKITSVTIPSVTRVAGYAFSECTSLAEVNLGKLTLIGDYAFYNTAIKTVPENSADVIGKYAFANTFITSVTISDGTVIGEGAFDQCKALASVTIGDNVEIGKYAFRYNNNRSDYTSSYYTVDGTRIFYYIYKSPLKSLTIGKNANIGEAAFWFASELKSVTLGEGAIIGNYAFYTAASLESIDLSKALSIGDGAFSGDILYEYLDQDLSTTAVDENGYDLYRYYAPKFVSVDLSSAEKIGKDAFAYCRELKTVTLGDAITEIPEGAFRYCSSLTSINLSKVVKIADYAFNRSAITSLTLDSAVEIGKFAFLESAALTSVTFSESIEKIDEGAFAYCGLLASANGLGGVEHVGDYAFAYTDLKEADLTDAVYLGMHAFMKDKENKCAFTVKLGTSLEKIGDNPFVWCVLTPFSTTEKETFNGKEYEKTVYTFNLGENVRIIDGSLYRVVPNGLELIYHCYMGGTAKVADGTVRIGAFAFVGSEVTNVMLPYTVEAIGHKAFYDCRKLSLVNFSSYYAPILEEEYDLYYFYEGTNMPTLPEYDTELGINGLGIIKYFMWNVTSDPTNAFYGANFVDYVGKVDDKVVMVRPRNGVGYDSFILGQYFDVVLEGASAADDVTLAAISAINKIPANSSNITLAHKSIIAAARAAYDKVVSDEQRALIPTELLTILKNAEQMIEDLEYLANDGDKDELAPGEDGESGVEAALVVLIVIVSVLALAVIALGVFIFIFVRKLKNGDIRVATKEASSSNTQSDEAIAYAEAEVTEKEALSSLASDQDETEDPGAEDASAEPFKVEVLDKPVNYDDITKGFEEKPSSVLRRKIILITSAVLAAIAVVTVVVVAIINANKTYYDTYDKEGYTISVAFDSNGGTFKGSKSSIVDLFRPEDIDADGLTLLAPDDVRRDKNNVMQITNPGYFLAGWYTVRTPIDENNPDAGYTYSGKWDFENNKIRVNTNEEYSADEPILTLYAAWVPYYNFEIYTTDESGNSILLSTVSALNLTIPEWQDGDVTLGMDNFPTRDGYTLESVEYIDTNIIETETENKKFITGKWDEATATSLTPTIRLHTEWKEGKTFRIYSVNDFVKNADLNGYYELYTDLDFTGTEWPAAFLNGKFNGKIYGNNHKISGVSFDSATRNRTSNGLFSSFGEGAYIENLAFENIVETVDLAAAELANNQTTTVGLLAGSADVGASFKNVKISGSLVFGDKCAELAGNDSFTVKTVIGSGSTSGITVVEITVVKKNEDNSSFNLKTEADGSVSIVSGN